MISILQRKTCILPHVVFLLVSYFNLVYSYILQYSGECDVYIFHDGRPLNGPIHFNPIKVVKIIPKLYLNARRSVVAVDAFTLKNLAPCVIVFSKFNAYNKVQFLYMSALESSVWEKLRMYHRGPRYNIPSEEIYHSQWRFQHIRDNYQSMYEETNKFTYTVISIFEMFAANDLFLPMKPYFIHFSPVIPITDDRLQLLYNRPFSQIVNIVDISYKLSLVIAYPVTGDFSDSDNEFDLSSLLIQYCCIYCRNKNEVVRFKPFKTSSTKVEDLLIHVESISAKDFPGLWVFEHTYRQQHVELIQFKLEAIGKNIRITELFESASHNYGSSIHENYILYILTRKDNSTMYTFRFEHFHDYYSDYSMTGSDALVSFGRYFGKHKFNKRFQFEIPEKGGTVVVTSVEPYAFITCYGFPKYTVSTYFMPFETKLWIAVLLSISLASLFLYVFGHSVYEIKEYSPELFALGFLLENSTDVDATFSNRVAFRFVVMGVMLSCIVLTNGYKGVGISTILSPLPNNSINSILDIKSTNSLSDMFTSETFFDPFSSEFSVLSHINQQPKTFYSIDPVALQRMDKRAALLVFDIVQDAWEFANTNRDLFIANNATFNNLGSSLVNSTVALIHPLRVRLPKKMLIQTNRRRYSHLEMAASIDVYLQEELMECNKTLLVGRESYITGLFETVSIAYSDRKFFTFKEGLFSNMYVWAFYKGAGSRVPKYFVSLLESGIYDFTKNIYQIAHFRTSLFRNVHVSQRSVVKVALAGNIQTIFYAWSMGISVAASLYMIEIIPRLYVYIRLKLQFTWLKFKRVVRSKKKQHFCEPGLRQIILCNCFCMDTPLA